MSTLQDYINLPTQVAHLSSQVAALNSSVATLQSVVVSLNSNIAKINSTITGIQHQINVVTAEFGTVIDTTVSINNVNARIVANTKLLNTLSKSKS